VEYRVVSSRTGSSIDCYIGSLARVLELEGVTVSESALPILLDANNMELVYDEHGEPELSFPSFNIQTDHLFNECGISRADVAFPEVLDRDSFMNVAPSKPFIAWVNSRGLPYLNDRYAQLGYMHCLAVESVNPLEVRVYDSFVVGVPPKTMVVDLPIDIFVHALNDRVSNSHYNLMGKFQSVCARNVRPECLSSTHLIRTLIGQASRYSSILSTSPTVQLYWRDNRELILEYSEPDQVINRLATMKHEIGTDFILPNRIAILNVLESATSEACRLDSSILLLQALIGAWRAILVTITRVMLTADLRLLEDLDGAFLRLSRLECDFWRSVAKL
jgi:hypothetical protein